MTKKIKSYKVIKHSDYDIIEEEMNKLALDDYEFVSMTPCQRNVVGVLIVAGHVIMGKEITVTV